MRSEVRVEFTPGGETVFVPPQTLILEAAIKAGIELQTPCGGKGKCARCRVIALSADGVSPADEVELASLSADDVARGVRLACRARVIADARIEVPQGSRINGGTILEAGLVRDAPLKPNVRRVQLHLPTPKLDDQRADLRRVLEGAGMPTSECEADLNLLRDLPQQLRAAGYAPEAVLMGRRVVEIRSCSSSAGIYGCAVDIGTTTVVAYLLDLESGQVLGAGSAPNPQGAHGADVVSRVEFADQGPEALATLHREAITIVNAVIAEACAEAGVTPTDVYEITVVGNTCMSHLFLGLSPHYLARAPYVPVIDQSLRVKSTDLGLSIHPRGEVHMLPNIAGWVGADTVGVLLSTRICDSSEPALAIDIGTNGEVMLWSGKQILVCSTAAGPAFEGAQIRHGMRAATGAIDHVRRADEGIVVETIGNAPAIGICGSGLMDAAAVLLEIGVISDTGLMADEQKAASLPETIARRLVGEGQTRQFILTTAEKSGTGEAITLTQRDVRQLQLAKGAVRAGIEVLLSESDLQASDLARILLAGAFGSYIDRASAVRLGLVPALPLARIIPVGNAAGAGAVLALLSTDEREKATQLAEQAVHVELSSRPEFQALFMETMLFQSG